MPTLTSSNQTLPLALVTGAAGQLGQALTATCPDGHRVAPVTRRQCDISDAKAIATLLDDHKPALLINAAAYTAVDRAETERDAAFAANALAPGLLAKACAERSIRLLHVSTDFVFDGKQSAPYTPDSVPAPQSVYGESKLAGEAAVASAAVDSLILRTGWVYSHVGANFMLTMLRLHRERPTLSVVADQVGTPTSAVSLAEALWAAARRPSLKGIYHWSDAGVCSWYDFAVAIGEEAQALGLLKATAEVLPIPATAYPTPARRPAYSVLDKRKSWNDLELSPVHWREWLRMTLRRLKEAPDHG